MANSSNLTLQDLSSNVAIQRIEINNAISAIQTMLPVTVVKQYGGGLDIVGNVDVVIATNLMTGNRKPVEHTVIYGVPYLRMQGGTDAMILDPKPGDTGFCGFCSREIAGFTKTRKAYSPRTKRKFNFADAVYLFGYSGVKPENYIMLKDGNITMKAKTITIDAGTCNINADTHFNGALTSNGKNISDSHTHKDSGGEGTGGSVS